MSIHTKKAAVSIAEAKRIILDAVTPLGSEDVSIMEAFNRVLYEDVVSNIQLPPVDDSAMDGYAVIAEDTRGASRGHPVRLEIAGEVQAGASTANKRVSKGYAVRIMTGAPIPEGADAVIKIEDTEEADGFVTLFREMAKHDNYRIAGETIAVGDRVLCRGERLNSAGIGMLASLNCNSVKVYRKPVVAIISTGNELADLGQKAGPHQIRDVNAYALHAEILNCNALPQYLGIARDTLGDTQDIFLNALRSDVVISTGGISMGAYDFVKANYADMNIDIAFEWINVKPGSPFTFGRKDHQLFFGLPGRPVSTLITFIQFVRPALLRLMGARKIEKPIVNAFLEEDIKNKQTDKVHLMRGYFTIRNNEFYVSTTGNQKPSWLRSMSDANCLIIIPAHTTRVKAGEKVAIQLIEHAETA